MSKKKAPSDSVVLPVRMKRELRDSFHSVVKTKDLSGSQIIRELIRRYIKDNEQIEFDL